ncbi:hypothetical protein CYMTET_46710 [Cymbomonas tetramitiformis]|uniref:Uncharacterized protein n=1 Tax=Cymbomonas tetramitiformis TaxID=36881 RepID=A0AAE0EX13_9CHLO|nr:hypothetical protein CYMTET_46710 [Cymbomonas tetramitiformis]|eukprot:gene18948-22641_t
MPLGVYPTDEEKAEYSSLCQDMGQDETVQGLVAYLQFARAEEEGGRGTKYASQEALFTGKVVKRERKKYDSSNLRNRGHAKPHERAVRSALNKWVVACEDFNSISNVQAQHAVYVDLVAKEEYELIPPANHPYSKVEEAKGLRIKTSNDSEKLAARKAAGIEPLALPNASDPQEESRGEVRACLLATWIKQFRPEASSSPSRKRPTAEGGADGEVEESPSKRTRGEAKEAGASKSPSKAKKLADAKETKEKKIAADHAPGTGF